MFKEVMKMKITENEMWFKICRALFYQKISCAKKIAEEIRCDSRKIGSRFATLKKLGIIEPTGIIPMDYLAKHKNGTFGKFYLLTETAREVMEEILREERENKKR